MNKRPPRNGENKEEKINTLLVDGNALFKTGFHGAKNEFNNNGQHVGGLYSFINIVRMLLVDDLYHSVYVFWDGRFSGKLRYNIYPPYKSGRGKDYINGTQPIDEDELTQRFMVQEYLEELFIRQLEHDVIESDDFIGYYCLNKKENEKISICTSDRDFLQLISDDVKIYFIDKKNFVDTTNYSSYFWHHRDNSVLMKTLLGDNSDSIKGVKGLGEGTLKSLFPELKERKVTLEEFIDRAKILQQERLDNKKPRLKVFDNIINGVTDGAQGDKLYEINDKLVNLTKPLMTEEGIEAIENLMNNTMSPIDRGTKNVFTKLKRDGLQKIIGEHRYEDYLTPFKKLIARENKNNDKEETKTL